jgi:hypothetical protein
MSASGSKRVTRLWSCTKLHQMALQPAQCRAHRMELEPAPAHMHSEINPDGGHVADDLLGGFFGRPIEAAPAALADALRKGCGEATLAYASNNSTRHISTFVQTPEAICSKVGTDTDIQVELSHKRVNSQECIKKIRYKYVITVKINTPALRVAGRLHMPAQRRAVCAETGARWAKCRLFEPATSGRQVFAAPRWKRPAYGEMCWTTTAAANHLPIRLMH